MSCYVDMLIDYGWKLGPSCHLLADTEEELHEMAAKIGMKRSWFQKSRKHEMPHYDLVASRRKKAVALGAIEINRKQLCEMLEKHNVEKINSIEHDATCIKCGKTGFESEWHKVGAEIESGYGGDSICDECYYDLIGFDPIAGKYI